MALGFVIAFAGLLAASLTAYSIGVYSRRNSRRERVFKTTGWACLILGAAALVAAFAA